MRFHVKFTVCILAMCICVAGGAQQQDKSAVAQALSSMNVWVLVQPKVVEPLPGVSFDLAGCKGLVGPEPLRQWAVDCLAASGPRLALIESASDGTVTLSLAGADDPAYAQLGDQAYTLTIDARGVAIGARTIAGLRHGVTTLAQIALDRTVLPGMKIRDWPSMKYRGVQQDISRGQVPTVQTLNRLADVLALAKMNVMELYLEHVYKYKAFPDISPPEGYTFEDAREMSSHAAALGVEVHPLLQGLGHGYHILSKPQYEHLRISPSEKNPTIMTFDVRKPEAVRMMTTMIDELSQAFPGELFNVDITEIDSDGLQEEGLALDQVTDVVFDYVLKLNEAVKKNGRRLMIAQGPLDSMGHLAGMGPRLDDMPRDVIIGSYYCAGGPYQPAWEKDFPRLREKGFDFFAQAWIYDHVWITPWLTKAAEFSDLEVSRGLQHGAIGSITCDWGDIGHFHFVGQEWVPYLYHGACTWTGAELDAQYFRKACASILYGLNTEAAIHAMEAAGSVNGMMIRVRDKDGKEVDVATNFMWEFVHDPFTYPDITRIVDPAGVGQAIVDTVTPALATLSAELPKARRNQDNLEQWVFGARCYAALGRKLIALGHFNDAAVPREQAADELVAVAAEFEALQAEFKRLWLAENRDNSGFQDLVKRFTYTIVPCREKAKEIRQK